MGVTPSKGITGVVADTKIFRESVVRRSLALLIFVVSLEAYFSIAHKLIDLQI